MNNQIILNNIPMSGERLEWLMQQDLQVLQHFITSHFIGAIIDNGTGMSTIPSTDESKAVYVLMEFLNHLAEEKPQWLAAASNSQK